jgi:hypothetical protein
MGFPEGRFTVPLNPNKRFFSSLVLGCQHHFCKINTLLHSLR